MRSHADLNHPEATEEERTKGKNMSDTKAKLREAAQKVFIDESAANLIAEQLEKMGLHVTQNPNPVSPNELKSGETTAATTPTPTPSPTPSPSPSPAPTTPPTPTPTPTPTPSPTPTPVGTVV